MASSSSMEEEMKTKKPKRRGLLSFLRAALFITKNGKKPLAQAEVAGSGGRELWRSLVCGMRPLHLQHLDDNPTTPRPRPVVVDSFHDVISPPPSESMSRYVSAEDLQALDVREDKDVEVEARGDGGSSEIDAKAEEYISRFYEQIRLQRLESMARVAQENAC